MNRFVMSAMVLSASMIGSQAVYAAPVHLNVPVRAAVESKVKLVKFSVRNDSKAPMKLKAGDNEVAIEPGKTANLSLPTGTQITTVEAANREAGSLVATVSDALSGNTLALR